MCVNIYIYIYIIFIYVLSFITDLLDHYLKTYEDLIVIGDFNESKTSPSLDSFLDEQVLKHKK